MMSTFCDQQWLRRVKGSRAVEVTPKGYRELKRQLGVDGQLVGCAHAPAAAASAV